MLAFMLCAMVLGCDQWDPAVELAEPLAASAAAPAPETPPRAEAVAAANAYRPTLLLECDEANRAFLRLEETRFDPFAPRKADRIVRDRKAGPDPGKSFVLGGTETVAVEGLRSTRMKYGLQLMNTPTVSVYDFTYFQFDGGGQIYGGALKLGNNRRPTTGVTYVQRVYANGKQEPDGSYKRSNTDFIGVEANNAPLYARNVTGRNFGDAGVDAKAKVYLMNATLDGAHRVLRAWGAGEIILVNSIINAAPGEPRCGCRMAARPSNTTTCCGATAPMRPAPAIRSADGSPPGSMQKSCPRRRRARASRACGTTPCPRSARFFARRLIGLMCNIPATAVLGAIWRCPTRAPGLRLRWGICVGAFPSTSKTEHTASVRRCLRAGGNWGSGRNRLTRAAGRPAKAY